MMASIYNYDYAFEQTFKVMSTTHDIVLLCLQRLDLGKLNALTLSKLFNIE